MKATMKDVAALAGVGVGTVSRVINKNGSVKESTRLKVEAAIQQLDYEPDEYARGLKTNRSNTIALILPTIWHPFFSEFAYYVERALTKYNYKMFLCNSDGDSTKENEYIQMVKQNKVDGIIGITYSDIDQYVSSNLPFVSVDRHFSEDVTYVTADNYMGGRIAAEELLKGGCQRLAYIGGQSPYPNETTSRMNGFEDVCKERHINYCKLVMPEPIQEVTQQILQFYEENTDIDGFFTVNDFMALNVIEALELIQHYPLQDFQIIGFDGIKMAVERQYIVSTIVQPVEAMAEAAVEALLNKIQGQAVPQRIVLPVQFRAHKTTKK